MKIKKMRFKNGYKRFHDLTIDLGEAPARIVALVGPNGCGKSSVLDGLDVRPSEAKAKIISDLNRAIANCLALEISSLGNVEGNRGTLYFKKADHPEEFEFDVLSSGEKEALL